MYSRTALSKCFGLLMLLAFLMSSSSVTLSLIFYAQINRLPNNAVRGFLVRFGAQLPLVSILFQLASVSILLAAAMFFLILYGFRDATAYIALGIGLANFVAVKWVYSGIYNYVSHVIAASATSNNSEATGSAGFTELVQQ
eukprot:TRINITY_DN10059_c1_g1_i1.p2 TRINITY_DN10059_c1_g1~~TRINITY_DN10059_c1_g1_i1.p2  ORF type:complete len:141 (+),score=27.10 TRINITY_DN10059_c1_g1_i1:93-515(+)